jgi:hypothetical protein
VADDTIDIQIMASRMAMQVLEKTSTELNDLRLRIQHLEKRAELAKGDVLLPDVVSRILVDQWLEAQLPREAWQLIQEALAPPFAGQAAGGLSGRQPVSGGQWRDEGHRSSATGQAHTGFAHRLSTRHRRWWHRAAVQRSPADRT